MNKFLFLMLLTCISMISLKGQEIIVQSNNAADLKQYESLAKATNIKTLKAKLENVVANNPDYRNTKIIIQITFFDPAVLGGLKLKTPHGHSADYIDIWKNTYIADDRMMLFFEKQGGKYIFKDFVVTDAILEGQIPDIVKNYITEQILKPEKEISKLVYKGINAVKNAYDRRFMNKMIDNVDKLIAEKKYYKGYTYTVYEYYLLENEPNTNILPYNFCDIYAQVPNGKIVSIHSQFSSYRTLPNILSSKYNFVYNDTLNQYVPYIPILDDIYVKNNQGSFIKYTITGYTKEHYVYAENGAKFVFNSQSHVNKIIETPYVYMGWERKKINNTWTQDLIFDSTRYYCDQQYRVVYRKGMFNAEEQIDTKRGVSRWPNFEYGQPTWCNQFARDLSKEMYGTYIIGSLSANNLFDTLSTSKDFASLQTIKSKKNGEDKIWQNYIDRGFLVFYLKKNSGSSGHIETCFPNGISNDKIYQKRHSDDTRYPEENIPVSTSSYTNLFIGAGSSVGYKYSPEWRNKIDTTPFLYLGFLKLEI
jgi:hypothetical protein